MTKHGVKLLCSALAGLTMLSACGQSGETDTDETAAIEAAVDPAITEVIEARQKALKDVGGAFKAISDQFKADSPDIEKIQLAAASVPTLTEGMAEWFPDGSGPEAGIETDALPAIWESKDDFLSKVSDFQKASTNLNTVAQSGDMAAIGAAFKETGGTCKACHDKYRLDD